MENSLIVNSNGQADMATLFKKTSVSQKDPPILQVLGTKKARNSKDFIKPAKVKINENRPDKEKVSQNGADIRNYFGKNSPESTGIDVAEENGKCSNVFSFMMATRHKQDEAIRELQARQLNEAEELLPNIMKSIPKEQLLANFISKAGKKQPQASPPLDSQENIKPVEQNILNNMLTPVSSGKVIHSVLSGRKSDRGKSKTVSFSQSVKTYEIIKEPDEHTWEFIIDSELNKSKVLAQQKTFSKLINYTGADLDVEVVFKEEIEQCMNSGTKKSKMKNNPKLKKQAKKCPKDESVSEKENIKVNNKAQLNIASFFKLSEVKNKQSKITLESELIAMSDEVQENSSNSSTNICNKVNSGEIAIKDNNEAIFQERDNCDKNSNSVKINNSSRNCPKTITVEECVSELILQKQTPSNNKTSTLRLFRFGSEENKAPLRRSLRLPKKRQQDDFISIDSDDNSNHEPIKNKQVRSSRSCASRMSQGKSRISTEDLDQDLPKIDSMKKKFSTPDIGKKNNKRSKNNQDSDEDSPIKILKIVCHDNAIEETTKKFASIFMKKDSQPAKPPICSTILRARRDFLFAETPTIAPSKQCTEELITLTWPPFPLQSHIRQTSDNPIWALPDVEVPLQKQVSEDSCDLSVSYTCPLRRIKDEGKINCDDVLVEPNPSLEPLSVHNILHHLKAKNPKFPVFNTFTFYLNCKIDFVELFAKEPFGVVPTDPHAAESSALIVQERPFLSKRKRSVGRLSSNKRPKLDEPSSQSIDSWHKWTPYSWTQVFAPKDASQVIANEGVKFQLKEWLEEWKHKSEVEDAKDRSQSRHRSSGAFSDSDESDDESVNTMLLSGPPGVGKTALVYALGQELGIKILEINASVRRQGKHIMTQLSEATQSHTVSSRNGCSLMSPVQKGEARKGSSKSRRRKNKNIISEDPDSMDGFDKEKNMALILFEDIDIIFEDYDEGFMSAVSHFMATTKRPIILTCNQPLAAMKAKIRGNFLQAEMKAPTPNLAANYLQLMCLANGVFVNSKELEHLVSSNKGDIRKSILDLQFWALSGSSNVQWLKMEKSKLCKMPSDDLILEGDTFPENFFPKLKTRKSVDVPISSGCMWAKRTFSLISSEPRDCEITRRLPWSSISGNLLTLLPFTCNIATPTPPMYPLSDRDPLILRAYEQNNYSWLLADDEFDQLAATESKEEASAASEPLPAALAATSDVLHSMASLFDRLCHLDVLETRRANAPAEMRAKYLTPLDDTCRESAVTLDHADLISELACGALAIEGATVRGCLSRCESMGDCLKATITSATPDILFEPHQHRKESDTRLITELNDRVRANIPLLYQPNHVAVATDYLPFVRDIARQDQLGRAMQKFKRSSRYLSHLKLMGYYLCPEDCLTVSNFLT